MSKELWRHQLLKAVAEVTTNIHRDIKQVKEASVKTHIVRDPDTHNVTGYEYTIKYTLENPNEQRSDS